MRWRWLANPDGLLVGIFNIYYIVKYASNPVFAERQMTVLGTAFQTPESRIVRNGGMSGVAG